MQYRPALRGRYAQQWDAIIFAEMVTLNQRVTGSSPVAPTKSHAQSITWRHGKLVVIVVASAGTK